MPKGDEHMMKAPRWREQRHTCLDARRLRRDEISNNPAVSLVPGRHFGAIFAVLGWAGPAHCRTAKIAPKCLARNVSETEALARPTTWGCATDIGAAAELGGSSSQTPVPPNATTQLPLGRTPLDQRSFCLVGEYALAAGNDKPIT